nr:ActS/PrrB/RegB family redox-sensitive histidine kinase [Pararhizobium haloflavum]
MTLTEPPIAGRGRYSRYRLRLQTLTRLRWLAVTGQSITVLVVAFLLEFPFPVLFCFALIACSAWLNVFLTFRYPATHRLGPSAAMGVLGFDVIQLTGLLYMTGGLVNPFSVLICVPVIISTASQPIRYTLVLGALTVASASALAIYHLPLPWYPGVVYEAHLVLIIGIWIAIISTTLFAAFYMHRVSSEANQLADALTATELTLQREQHLFALDGLAAAAAHELGTPLATISVVAKEMERALGHDERYREDLQLLRSQSERCRDILRRLTTLSTDDEEHMRKLPLSSLIEEVVAPHREFGVSIDVDVHALSGSEPVGLRNAGILYGLGNLVENAVDFAATRVTVDARYDDENVVIIIADDGPGFPPEIQAQIGEPFLTRRASGKDKRAGGLGLGLFIAKTLLERTGAAMRFENRVSGGARITMTWPRAAMDAGQAGSSLAQSSRMPYVTG